jgi:DNA repair ATPase RecN
MSLEELEVRRALTPLEKELSKQKEKNGRLKKQVLMAKEDMKERMIQEVANALDDASEDPRAIDSMLDRLRGVETKRTPLRDKLSEVSLFLRKGSKLLRVLSEYSSSSSIRELKQEMDSLQSSISTLLPEDDDL